MRIYITLALTIFLFTNTSNAIAGSDGSGLIKDIVIATDGRVTFTVEVQTNVPTCKTFQWGSYSFSSTTSAGKAQLALLIAAAARKQPIAVKGAGTCTHFSSVEDIDYFSVTY